MKGNISHIDCFAGPGGICTGLHAAGFKTYVDDRIHKELL